MHWIHHSELQKYNNQSPWVVNFQRYSKYFLVSIHFAWEHTVIDSSFPMSEFAIRVVEWTNVWIKKPNRFNLDMETSQKYWL